MLLNYTCSELGTRSKTPHVNASGKKEGGFNDKVFQTIIIIIIIIIIITMSFNQGAHITMVLFRDALHKTKKIIYESFF